MKPSTFRDKAIAEAAARGWRMMRLAREADVSYDIVREMYRRPTQTPRLDAARKIAAVLGFSVDDFADEPATDDEREVLEAYRSLTDPENRKKALAELRFLHRVEHGNKGGAGDEPEG